MKKLLYFFSMVALLVTWGSTNSASAQGWPQNYGGVMLQGFYWDSFDDTQWALLESQADELAGSFSLIWIPQSAKGNDGIKIEICFRVGYRFFFSAG